jgi:hypothetical protein
MGTDWHIVTQKPESRCIAIRKPNVKIAILIPINRYQRATVVGKIHARCRRDIGKGRGTITQIQITAISFLSAK